LAPPSAEQSEAAPSAVVSKQTVSTTAAVNAQHLETAVIGVRGALDNESRPDADAAAAALGGVKQAARQPDQTLADVQPAAAPG
jgi:hypothetical protein